MKTTTFLMTLLALFVITTASAKIPAPLVQTQQTSMSSMLKKTMPAIINIRSEGEITLINDKLLEKELQNNYRSMPRDPHFTGIGSGVIVDSTKGIILTNAHVIDLAKTIIVTLSDGRHYQAKKIGVDNDSDIAVIQINAKNLTAITLGDSNVVQIGDFVAAIGSPFGLNQSVTSGIVSAIHRGDLGIEGLENFIQTDAPINVGNSGGALVNMQGELIGINTALISNSGGNIGIGFAIPINMAQNIMQQILKFGEVRRGLMGVLVQTLSPDLASAFGVPDTQGAVVTQIIPYSPAANAGLQIGDIITSINGQTVQNNLDIHNAVGLLRIGSNAKLTLLRNTKPLTIQISTVNPQDTEMKNESADPYLYGVQMKEVQLQDLINGYIVGIKILKIKDYSAAAIAGLQPGDIIISANHKNATSIPVLLATAQNSKNGLLLNILRKGGAAFVVIK